jgi:hypothetical protein
MDDGKLALAPRAKVSEKYQYQDIFKHDSAFLCFQTCALVASRRIPFKLFSFSIKPSMNTTRALLWLVAVASISCHAFVPSRVAVRPRSPLTPPPSYLRNLPVRSKDTSLNGASLADYSGAAQTLFGNVISPAALLAGKLLLYCRAQCS